MSQQARDRSHGRSRQPKSLESLYNTVQNACISLQNTLDRLCKQCEGLNIDTDGDEHIVEISERLDALEAEAQLAMFSDAQCQLLVEDLDLDISENIVIDIIKRLRDLELLRKNASTFFKNLNKRFSSILNEGLYLYCVSLIEITHEEVEEVIKYDEYISDQKLEISQAVDEIHHMIERWGNLTLDLHSTIENLDGLKACLTDIQARWSEAKEKISEWINQDREYPNRLTSRINENKNSIQCLLLEMDMLNEAGKRRAERRRYHQAQIESLQKKRRELHNNYGQIQRAKKYNTSKLVVYDSGLAQETDNGKKLDSKKDSGSLESQEEIHKRRGTRLDKELDDVKESLTTVVKKIKELKRASEEDEGQKDTSMRRANEIRIEIAVMERTLADCRDILLQRGKVQTLIQLRKGAITKSKKDEIAFEEACRFVTRRVRHEWPRLYLHLPMWPIRSHDQRLEDINGLLGYERMNVILPRNRTSFEDAAAALAKWRLLSRRYTNVEGLVTGLSNVGWLKLANEVRKRFMQEMLPEGEECSEKGKEIVEENARDQCIETNEPSADGESNREFGIEASVSSGEGIGEANNFLEGANNEMECESSDTGDESSPNTAGEDNQNKSSRKSSKFNSVEEVTPIEEGKRVGSQEGIPNTKLAEAHKELEETTDINNSKKSKEDDGSSSTSSAISSRRNSKNGKASKKENIFNKEGLEEGETNPPDKDDISDGQTSKRENQNKTELKTDSKSKAFKDEAKEEAESKDYSSLKESKYPEKAEELKSSEPSQECFKREPDQSMRKKKDVSNEQEDQKEENLEKDSKSESSEIKNEKRIESEIKNSSKKPGKKSDSNDRNDLQESVGGKKNEKDEKLANSDKKPEEERAGNEIVRAKPKPKTKSNERPKKDKPKCDKVAKVQSDKKDNKSESIKKKEGDEAETGLSRSDHEGKNVEKDESKDKSSRDFSKAKKVPSEESAKIEISDDKETEDPIENEERTKQDNGHLMKAVKESKESESMHKVSEAKPKEKKKAKNHPSEAKLKEKSKDKKDDNKSAKKLKSEEGGKKMDKKKK